MRGRALDVVAVLGRPMSGRLDMDVFGRSGPACRPGPVLLAKLLLEVCLEVVEAVDPEP